MVIGVGYQDVAISKSKAERMLQAHPVADAVDVAKVEEVAANQCANGGVRRREVDRADDVRFAIGDIESLAVRRQPRRLRESGPQQLAVSARFLARAGEVGDLLLFEIKFPDLMRPGHGDVEDGPDKL